MAKRRLKQLLQTIMVLFFCFLFLLSSSAPVLAETISAKKEATLLITEEEDFHPVAKTEHSEADLAESSQPDLFEENSEEESVSETASSVQEPSKAASETEVGSSLPSKAETSAAETPASKTEPLPETNRLSHDDTVSAESNNELWNTELSVTLSMACEWVRNSDMGDLYFFCMGAAGKTAPSKVVNQYITDVSLRETYDEPLYRAYDILNVTYCGYDAVNIFGRDLVQELIDSFYYEDLDLHNSAYILLALDCNGYDVSKIILNSRENIIKHILSFQNEDGGFAATQGGSSSVTKTALAIVALASRRDQIEGVSEAISSALRYLEHQQQADGSFLEDGKPSSSAVSKVIVALNCLGLSIKDPRFTKGNENLIQILMRHINLDGGFSEIEGSASDVTATENAILALTAVKKQSSPYRMGSILIEETASNHDFISVELKNHDWIMYLWSGFSLLAFLFFLYILFHVKFTNRGPMSEEEKFLLYGIKEETDDHTDLLEEPDPRRK